MNAALGAFAAAIGAGHVLQGADCAPYCSEPTTHYTANPLAVLRPANTGEVSACLKIATQYGVSIVPTGGGRALRGLFKRTAG